VARTRDSRLRISALHAIFAAMVVLCLGEIAWWIIFHWREAGRLEEAGRALVGHDIEGAARALGADSSAGLAGEAHRRLVMFVSEGAALGLAVLVGILILYWTVQRERRALAAQERFVAGATHAWRTPLTTLRLGLESLQADRVPDSKRERYLRAMLAEIDRLERDVGNLLAAAKADRSDKRGREHGDLRTDLERAISTLGARAEAAGVAIAIETDAAPVQRDPEAIALTLQNLLDNAIKYSARGGRIAVSLRARSGIAELRIRDEGVGMTRDDLKDCFTRFVRGSAKEHAGGSGLGLWVAKETLEAHGGTLEAHSDGPGKGSELVARLPLSRVAP